MFYCYSELGDKVLRNSVRCTSTCFGEIQSFSLVTFAGKAIFGKALELPSGENWEGGFQGKQGGSSINDFHGSVFVSNGV